MFRRALHATGLLLIALAFLMPERAQEPVRTPQDLLLRTLPRAPFGAVDRLPSPQPDPARGAVAPQDGSDAREARVLPRPSRFV